MEDVVEIIKNKVTKLMYENWTIFPIVEDIVLAAKHYKVPTKELEFYVRETLSSRVGLSYVIRGKLRAMNDAITFYETSKDFDMYTQSQGALIRSILSEYFMHTPTKQQLNKFHKLS